jgi:hypothetical protein
MINRTSVTPTVVPLKIAALVDVNLEASHMIP